MPLRCNRFSADGTRCANRTTNADAWCRRDGCGGFTRVAARAEPTAREPAPEATPQRTLVGDALPISIDELDGIRLSLRAVDSFRHHHGGSSAAARLQLEMMIEDFSLAGTHLRDGKLRILRHQGYELLFDPATTALIGYSTVHRDRTWEQVKAGVPSRMSRKTQAAGAMRAWTEQRPAGEPVLSAEALRDALDPDAISVSPRAAARWEKLSSARGADTDTTDARDGALREALRAAVCTGQIARREDGLWLIAEHERQWLITEDGAGLIAMVPGPPPG